MDSLITARGSTTGSSYTYLTTITATSYQLYSVSNIDQYTALIFYLIYPNSKAVVASLIMNIDRFKNTAANTGWAHVSYYDGSIHYGRIYYGDSNSIYGMVVNADSVEVYGIK